MTVFLKKYLLLIELILNNIDYLHVKEKRLNNFKYFALKARGI